MNERSERTMSTAKRSERTMGTAERSERTMSTAEDRSLMTEPSAGEVQS